MNQVQLSAPRARFGLETFARWLRDFWRNFVRLKCSTITMIEKENEFLRLDARRQAREFEQCTGARLTSEKSFRLLADHLTELVWTTYSDGRADFFNQRWHDYTGLTGGELKLLGWRAILHPDDVQRFYACWIIAFVAGNPYRSEFRLKPVNDSDYRWCSVYVFPQRDGAGKIERWIGVAFTGEEAVDDAVFDTGPH